MDMSRRRVSKLARQAGEGREARRASHRGSRTFIRAGTSVLGPLCPFSQLQKRASGPFDIAEEISACDSDPLRNITLAANAQMTPTVSGRRSRQKPLFLAAGFYVLRFRLVPGVGGQFLEGGGESLADHVKPTRDRFARRVIHHPEEIVIQGRPTFWYTLDLVEVQQLAKRDLLSWMGFFELCLSNTFVFPNHDYGLPGIARNP